MYRVPGISFYNGTTLLTTSAFNSDGDAVAFHLLTGGSGGTTYTVTATYPSGDSYYLPQSASTAVTVTVTGTSYPTTTGVYNYYITTDGTLTGPSGYDGVGNITAYYDSTAGQWSNIQYDALNRLVRADGPTLFNGSSPYFCWTYDDFGNRTSQNSEPTGPFTVVPTVGSQSCTAYSGVTPTTGSMTYNANNQIAAGVNSSWQTPTGTVTMYYDGSPSYPSPYDASGNLTNDVTNSYLYDAEGRICAMSTTITGIGTTYTGYLYDAEGRRVAKGTLSSWSCIISAFTMTNMYVLGPDGQAMTELDGSGAWKHTDVSAGAAMATYDSIGLHFQFADWLGSRRVQTDYKGTAETSFQNLPFGELISSLSGDATEKHFTGKERDSESGLDYFGARYYASGNGRWMSADWSAKPEEVPYSSLENPQSLNLYIYVKNNPLSRVDIDGHGELWDKFKEIFYAKGTVGVGDGAEVKLTKYLTAGAHISAGLEHKQTTDGSKTSIKVEGKAGLTVGKVDLSLKPSAEMQLQKDGHLDVQKPEFQLGLPSLGNDDKAKAQFEAAPNEIGVSGHYEALGGEVGIDVDKAKEFGQAVGQSLSDLGGYIRDKIMPDPSGPQNIPSPVPQSPF